MATGTPITGRPIVVMKFGGTSTATTVGRRAIADRVTEALEVGQAPVVVVSAMGRAGDPYATDTLLGLLDGLDPDARERDLMASMGEVISAIVVSHELRNEGIAARAMTGADAGIMTDGLHDGASITEVHTGPVMSLIAQGTVPVICGFQGMSADGAVTTLGRGGSDTTACALGVALSAAEVHIYTDVDGVMTADPRRCDSAEVIEVIGAEELFQMARSGSRVVHTPAAELALSSGLAVRVRNTYSDHPGTLVADLTSYKPSSVATAVTHADGVSRIRVALPGGEGTAEHTAAQTRIYRAMAEAGVSLDMFTPAGDSLFFTVTRSALKDCTRVLDDLALAHEVTDELAKVTLVGAGMHGVPGVMARVAEALAGADVNVWQTADSHTTISVLVPQDSAERAVRALHDHFELS